MSSSTDEEREEWEDWSGLAEEEDDQPVQSLFSTQVFPSVLAALQHDSAAFGFDLRQYRTQEGLDDYQTIKVVNYCRSEVAAGRDPLQGLVGPAAQFKPWLDDSYLQPVLEDDALLFYDFEAGAAEPMDTSAQPQPVTQSQGGDQVAQAVQQLQVENASLRAALQQAALDLLDPEVQQLVQDRAESSQQATTSGQPPQGALELQRHCIAVAVAGKGKRPLHPLSELERVDQKYFDSYSFFSIHREMLEDSVRTEAYRQALEVNPGWMKGKVVLDVGCGTGILSLFAARAGASVVIGVDGSERIAGFARQIVQQNGLAAEAGGPVSIMSGRVEDIEQLDGVEKVDVIVSEWMGYALLYECMLDTVLHARDRWLAPGGVVLPDRASIYVAGGGPGAVAHTFWRNVYGFDMEPIGRAVHEASLQSAAVAIVSPEDILTEPVLVHTLDIMTMTAADADFTAEFTLSLQQQAKGECNALVLWFDTDFSSRHCTGQPVTLSTSPHQKPTHWAQTILTLRSAIPLGGEGSGERAVGIRGRLSMARGARHRNLDISIECAALYSDDRVGPVQTNVYLMGATCEP